MLKRCLLMLTGVVLSTHSYAFDYNSMIIDLDRKGRRMCHEISMTEELHLASGVFSVDPDGDGETFYSMAAFCNMLSGHTLLFSLPSEGEGIVSLYDSQPVTLSPLVYMNGEINIPVSWSAVREQGSAEKLRIAAPSGQARVSIPFSVSEIVVTGEEVSVECTKIETDIVTTLGAEVSGDKQIFAIEAGQHCTVVLSPNGDVAQTMIWVR